MKGTPTIDNKGKASYWVWTAVLVLPVFANALYAELQGQVAGLGPESPVALSASPFTEVQGRTTSVRGGRAALSLDPATGVVPRIFSPNGDGVNDVVFFKVLNPEQSYVSGVVFDMSGAQVSSLVLAPGGVPTIDGPYLYWNGRDENGNLVPPGPYLYRIDGEGSVLSGVVVVAR